jgi:hypothetical protein
MMVYCVKCAVFWTSIILDFFSVSQHFGKWYCLHDYVEEGQIISPEQDPSPVSFAPEG